MSVPEQLAADFDLSDRTNAEILNATNGETVTAQREFRATAMTLGSRLEPGVARRVIEALRSASESDALVDEAVKLMRSGEGIDVNHPTTRGILDSLLDTPDASAVKALADTTTTAAERDYGRRITVSDIQKARAL